MYCPRCGQQQIADTTRFCSRCGLPTNELSEWLASGGAVPLAKKARTGLRSPKRKGVRRGAKLLFLSAVLAPIFLALSFAADTPVPLFFPFAVFLGGLSIVLYSIIFGEDAPLSQSQATLPAEQTRAAFGASALAPASNLWTTNVEGRRARTAEIVQPPSVTEQTTRLLDDD